ncbi:hypothetical protein HPB49_002796 [Dermacentor silvarum]|uniref:Uncharacterized protein n=1 Tax=Dermacentor silvarum TaxID=543639 RepID=A0ACB8CP30_DERSI|nr:hypothetical protein HPB49_002796 [Dermacentor silvarum]
MEEGNIRSAGRPRKMADEGKTKYNIVSAVDRSRIIDAHRRGGDLKQLAETLGINIKTVPSIAATDRETAKKRGVDKVHWAVFNEFLCDVSEKVHHQEPGAEAVFLFDNAPAHRRAEAVVLATSEHSMKRLPPCSPFFNPIEEVFSKFKAGVKTFLAERQDDLFTTPPVLSKKQHRRALLVEAAGESMQHVLRVECAAYDRHNYTFVQAALECHDM